MHACIGIPLANEGTRPVGPQVSQNRALGRNLYASNLFGRPGPGAALATGLGVLQISTVIGQRPTKVRYRHWLSPQFSPSFHQTGNIPEISSNSDMSRNTPVMQLHSLHWEQSRKGSFALPS